MESEAEARLINVESEPVPTTFLEVWRIKSKDLRINWQKAIKKEIRSYGRLRIESRETE